MVHPVPINHWPAIVLCLACGCAPAAMHPTRPLSLDSQSTPPTEGIEPASESTELTPASSLEQEPALNDELPSSAAVTEQTSAEPKPHPLDELSDEEVKRRVKEDLASLGSMSIGPPNGGSLLNAVKMPEDDRWHLVDPGLAYGTQETVDALQRVIIRVNEQFPNTPPLHIGHISGRRGGHLSPHVSHQSGRDVDLAYYYSNGGTWYQRATEENLDVARTWALVRALIAETDVRFLLIDHSVQRLLRAHADAIGEDQGWLDDVFKGTRGKTTPLIRHVAGHATHLHVRFHNPIAEETARRCYPALVALGKIKPPTYYIQHKARKGDSLIKLAKRYGTTVRTIQRANGMRGTVIFARKTYRIPKTGPAALGHSKVVIPARRPPPFDPQGNEARNEARNDVGR